MTGLKCCCPANLRSCKSINRRIATDTTHSLLGKVSRQSKPILEKRLIQSTLDIFDRMFRSIAGRQLVVPLSAGYDSRLIIALASHFGHKDVVCFTYGRPGNFEATTSKQLCDRLDIPWLFVPASVRDMRSFYASTLCIDYLSFADQCSSVPFIQDVFALDKLLTSKQISRDCVIVNGQSGDFTSGNHIPASFATERDLSESQRRSHIINSYLTKHFALWQTLRTDPNLAIADHLVWQQIQAAGGELGEPDTDHGLYEFAEFQDRQSKYVISGQRCYDFLGLDWRLPLWDADLMLFWQSVPLELKLGQQLYKDALLDRNWANIWQDLPVNRKTIRPRVIAPLRQVVRTATAPLGQKRWHEIERRLFFYWMELTCHTATVSYSRWATDRRGPRNTVSWLAEQYLSRHGLPLDPAEAVQPPSNYG